RQAAASSYRPRRHALVETGHRVSHGGEPEIRQQPLQPRRGPPQSTIVSDARDPGDIKPWLGGIELPRMDIKRAAHAAALALAERGANYAVGQEPEVRASGGGQTQPAPAQCGRRNFRESPVGTLQPVRIR